jgi:hypothetical protein
MGDAAAPYGRSLDDPLNGKAAQVVTSTGAEAGVAQAHFCVRAGETYHGSLWARGSAPDGLVVRLRDGDTTLAEARLPAPADKWHEHTFRLQPKAGARDATLEVFRPAPPPGGGPPPAPCRSRRKGPAPRMAGDGGRTATGRSPRLRAGAP